MKTVNIIFPHQLFKENPLFNEEGDFYIIEEPLYFNYFKFHVQKLILHRASMKYYFDFLLKKNKVAQYLNFDNKSADVRALIPHLKKNNCSHINYIDTNDNYIERRLLKAAKISQIKLNRLESPMFLNSSDDLEGFFNSKKKKFFQTSFYIQQRKKLGILLDSSDGPIGGKWSFDTENRKKYPKGKTAPKVGELVIDEFFKESLSYVQENFKSNPGEFPDKPIYPHNHKLADEWLELFLFERLNDFGAYEDAMVQTESFLNHSVLSPLLNCGLITPKQVIKKILLFQDKYPLNSIEGFIRQITGWREFIRGIYLVKGSEERTTNFFKFNRKIPSSFYDGTTGVLPVDVTIKKVQKTAYNHHIERLMVLGNFMMLCEFDPDEVYKWFMEHYIDAYDWVMVPNIYGMSQFADGGLMSSKPYISSSNYLKKMSDFPDGDWRKIWDGLYWRFIDLNRDLFNKNIRMKFMVNMLDKMTTEKKESHFNTANSYLSELDKI